MKYFSQFILFLLAIMVFTGLQYQYRWGPSGNTESARLQNELQMQQQANEKQRRDNDILLADVHDLKTGLEAVEEHARLDLGLIKPHETFVQLSTAATTHASEPTPLNYDSDSYVE